MALEDDLKSRASALISQQMANWVVEIQRSIQGHQAALVRALDELGEDVARYDEKIDEDQIGASMAEAVQQSGPAAGGGADYSKLKASIAAIEKGANLSEVLTHLVNEVSTRIDRVAMFIVKAQATVGWYAAGMENPEAVKTVSVPLTADTVFRAVANSRQAERGHTSQTPGTAQALARLGGAPQGVLAVPLILRDKVAAVLYCDTAADEVPADVADEAEILVAFAAKVIDVLSGGPRAAAGGTSPSARSAPRRLRPPQHRAPAPAPAPEPRSRPGCRRLPDRDVRDRDDEAPAGSAGRPGSRAPRTPVVAVHARGSPRCAGGTAGPPPSTPPSAPPAAPDVRAMSPEEQKAHDDARRFARLVVSEIKLYNEAKVTEGRKTRDIYDRLKEDIERGRQMYVDRVAAEVRDTTDYFQDELVRILGGGDANTLGSH